PPPPAPAEAGPPGEPAGAGTRCVDQDTVEVAEIGQLECVGVHDPNVLRAEPFAVALELAGSPFVLLDRDDLRGRLGELRRLAPGRCAEVEDPLTILRAH